MEYKGYYAEIEYDEDTKRYYGRVINTRDIITFHGETIEETNKEFEKSVDDYLDF